MQFVTPTYAVAGTVFNDTDGDGVADTGESGTQGGTVYDDADGDNTLDATETSVATDSVGRFTINLTAGNHTLRHIPPAGYRNTGQSLATAVSGSTFATNNVVRVTTDTNLNQLRFGQRPIPVTGASASGIVFADADQNGAKGASEAGISDVTVYVDLDNDKVLDANEAMMLTDRSGAFSFSNLPDTGSITRLRIKVPNVGTQTLPTNGFGYALTFGVGATNAGKNFGVYLPPTDTTRPIVGMSYSNVTEQLLRLQFSESVAGSFTVADLVLKNTTTGAIVPTADLTLTATGGDGYELRYKTSAATTPLPRGRYTLSLNGAGVTDAAGNAIAGTPSISFAVQPGDVNSDGITDFADLVILARNYNQVGKNFTEGNVNYSADGKVDFADLVMLAQSYNQALSASLVPMPAVPAATFASKKVSASRTVSELLA